MEWHLQHCESDANSAGAHRQCRCKQQRVVIDTFSGEIMLCQPYIVEPQRFSSTHLLNLLFDADRVLIRRWRQCEGEPTKLHVVVPSGGWQTGGKPCRDQASLTHGWPVVAIGCQFGQQAR